MKKALPSIDLTSHVLSGLMDTQTMGTVERFIWSIVEINRILGPVTQP
jgi:hypothetical protein